MQSGTIIEFFGKNMSTLSEKHNKEVVKAMMEKFGYKNSMAVPRIKKIVLNTGFGRLVAGKTSDEQKKLMGYILEDLSLICGQRPVVTKAKRSMPLGATVTLRGKKMYDFIEKLIDVSLPRSKDFKGLDEKSFDKKGNFTLAIKEDIIFPEISPENVKITFSFEITVVTTAKNREEGIELLKLMGFPFKK